MPKDVYVPFDDPKLMNQGAKVAQHEGGHCYGHFDELKSVTTLIVLAHSGAGEGLLYNDSTGSAEMNAKTLAQRLVDRKLSRHCTSIDLIACEAGHLAADLKKELHNHGLIHVEVNGYSSPLGVGKGQVQVLAAGLKTAEGKKGNRFATITGKNEGSGKRP